MLRSLDGVFTLTRIAGIRGEGAPRFVLEIPHGSTRTEQFEALRTELASPLLDGLVDFFHVNTDAGAPELGQAIARRLVTLDPTLVVAILTSEIPRTFIDCNRVLDAAKEAYKEGKVTPGVPPWITAPGDHALLRERHARYIAATDELIGSVCGAGGKAVLLHTYAPRSVDVEVGLDIVSQMRAAYAPEKVDTWPMRPALDVIGRTHEGQELVDAALFAALREAGSTLGLDVALSGTYPVHPTTHAWRHAHAWPGRVLCLEVRRDLVADPFEPFAQMRIGSDKVERLAAALAPVLARW